MKIIFSILLAAYLVVFFVQCKSSAKVVATPSVKPTVYYDTDVMPLISAHCSPCHIPAKGGNKEALDSYEAAKHEIGSIIKRISLNPGDRGFMPQKHEKLSDSIIQVFVKWKEGGLAKAK